MNEQNFDLSKVQDVEIHRAIKSYYSSNNRLLNLGSSKYKFSQSF
jgi:hypothetical protein